MQTSKKNIKLGLKGIFKSFETPYGPYKVIKDFNLEVEENTFISIVGHSGCGKSTILSMIAGLTTISEGSIILNGQPIVGAGLDRGVVFQSPNLLPWLNVLENVMLGVSQIPGLTKKERFDRCYYYLNLVGLTEDIDKKSHLLSEGMKQQVGLARAMALIPEVLLFDEPFAMLDSLTRVELQNTLVNIRAKEKMTVVMVTHDVDEAIYLSDKIVIMTKGPESRVGSILDIDIQKPIIQDNLENNNTFKELKEKILQILEFQ